MSSEAEKWALQQKVGDSVAKLILASLGNHHHPSTGRCFPKLATLMAAAECSRSTVIRKLKFLEDRGWIKSISRYDANGRQTSNEYALLFSRGQGVTLTPSPFEEARTARVSEGHPAVSGGNGGGCQHGDTPIILKEKNELGAPTGAGENLSPEEVSTPPAPRPAPVAAPAATVDWRNRLIQYRKRAIWAKNWGPPMHAPGCLVPPELVREWDATQGKAFVEEEQKPAWQGRKKRDWQAASSAIN